MALDCGDASCTGIHDLGPLPNESREDWIARLKARFAANPVPGASLLSEPIVTPATRALLVDCERCGGPRWRGQWCWF